MDANTGSIFQASCLASGLVTPQQLDYSIRVARHRLTEQGLSGSHASRDDSPTQNPPATSVSNPGLTLSASDAATPVQLGEQDLSPATTAFTPDVPDRILGDILIEQKIITAYQADQLMAGRTKFSLGSYVITEWIGQGGMGQVFKAVHHVMGRVCAVKVLPLARATHEARQNFVQEIRMQAALDCPYLVRAYDAGQDGSVHYLVTEYVPGMDLRRLVRSQGPLPVSQAARIVMQAALGLEYAHQQGMVHRDVKPGNILVTPEGEAKVSDVGLAGFAKDLINDPRAGKIVGTTDYLSPEQIRTPLEIDPASDIYSLGCTLYYAICGKVPFPGGDTKSKIRRHLEESPVHPRRFAPDVPEDFVDIIADMMEKDPRKRIANATQVAVRLEPWATEQTAVSALALGRSPWLAPPPPSHEEHYHATVTANHSMGCEPVDSTGDDRVGHTASGMSGSASGVSSSPSITAAPAPPDGSLNPPDATYTSLPHAMHSQAPPPIGGTSRQSPSTMMIVALTIAIILPPALMLGAILGFIVASK